MDKSAFILHAENLVLGNQWPFWDCLSLRFVVHCSRLSRLEAGISSFTKMKYMGSEKWWCISVGVFVLKLAFKFEFQWRMFHKINFEQMEVIEFIRCSFLGSAFHCTRTDIHWAYGTTAICANSQVPYSCFSDQSSLGTLEHFLGGLQNFFKWGGVVNDSSMINFLMYL